MHARRSRHRVSGSSLPGSVVGLLLLCLIGSSESAAPTPPNPPGKVPEGVILVKGAWSSASDSVTPLPEGGTVTSREYNSPYFHLSYPISSGWIQQYAGPPPSESGYYVLAQIQSPDAQKSASRGTVLIAAQDMFFTPSPAKNALELVSYTGSHLRADYVVERQPTEVRIAGHSFVRLDYVSPVARLHWAVLATQIRCHTVQFTFTSTDPELTEHLVKEMSAMKLPPEAGLASGAGGGNAPLCVKDFASGGNVLNRVDPIFTDRRYNPIPVRVVIGANGSVKHIHFISSFPEQAKTIATALRQWRFKPYVINGKAVEVETGILFGTPPNKALISGRQDPQLVPARRQAPTWLTAVSLCSSMARRMVFRPTAKHEQTSGPGSSPSTTAPVVSSAMRWAASTFSMRKSLERRSRSGRSARLAIYTQASSQPSTIYAAR